MPRSGRWAWKALRNREATGFRAGSSRRLLLLDEPTSATDIAGNDLVEEALKRYRESTGCTIIFASHSLPQAMRLADQALLLDDGLIIESGPVSRVILQPESERGKAFLQHWRV